jgi:quercetin dioxygenase-like cupin family protein
MTAPLKQQMGVGFVVEGRVSLTLGPETHVLGPGDAAMILPKELRLWENTSAGRVRILIVSLRSSSALQGEP